jgi:hypothetical protein
MPGRQYQRYHIIEGRTKMTQAFYFEFSASQNRNVSLRRFSMEYFFAAQRLLPIPKMIG